MSNIFDLFKQIETQRESTVGTPVEWIIVGLGNPGAKYECTRHNAGFRALDILAAKCNAGGERAKYDALIREGMISGKRAVFMKPQTFMNLSGKAVAAAANFYKIPAERIIVMCDDVNLDVGNLRVRRSGSAGGQNGMKNIIECIGSQDYPRIKIGVGKKPRPEYDLADWVLSKFTADEEKKLEPALARAAEAAVEIAAGRIDNAMNIYNRSVD